MPLDTESAAQRRNISGMGDGMEDQTMVRSDANLWCRLQDLNPRPPDYKSSDYAINAGAFRPEHDSFPVCDSASARQGRNEMTPHPTGEKRGGA